VHFDLPPDIEREVVRVGIGAGQEDTYSVIPAAAFQDPQYPGLTSFLSRWQFSEEEKRLIARSNMRAAVLAFAIWVQENSDAGEVTDMGVLAARFLEERHESFDGPDGDLYYIRLQPKGDDFQPMQMIVDVEAPLGSVVVPQDPGPQEVPLNPLGDTTTGITS
jgi:hypothetical protein